MLYCSALLLLLARGLVEDEFCGLCELEHAEESDAADRALGVDEIDLLELIVEQLRVLHDETLVSALLEDSEVLEDWEPLG